MPSKSRSATRSPRTLAPPTPQQLRLHRQWSSEFANLFPDGPKPAAVRRWADSLSPTQQSLASRLCFGTIEWPRLLGRPSSPQLSEAFQVEHLRWQEFMRYREDGTVEFIPLLSPYSPPPQPWDGPSDDSTWRVSFCIVLGAEVEQGVRVSVRNEVQWYTPKNRPLTQVLFLRDLRRFRRSEAPRVLEPFRPLVR